MKDAVFARCPAKVNLSLRVLGRRSDGYHEIDTVFQAVSLWDEIEARPAEGLDLICDDPALPVDRSNLVLRAASLLRDEFPGLAAGVQLRLRKRIPIGAGLGGGSSDAAATLLVLARLWGIEADGETLAKIAARIGSDVAFFLVGGTARGTGRGERIAPLPFLGEAPILIGCPPFGILTADVYGRVGVRLTHPENSVTLRGFSSPKWSEQNDLESAVNDLERVVFGDRPELLAFRDALRSLGSGLALMSGSGSSVFGAFRTAALADQARVQLAERFPEWRLYTTRAIERGAHVVREVGDPADRGDGKWRSPRFGSSPSRRTSSKRSSR